MDVEVRRRFIAAASRKMVLVNRRPPPPLFADTPEGKAQAESRRSVVVLLPPRPVRRFLSATRTRSLLVHPRQGQPTHPRHMWWCTLLAFEQHELCLSPVFVDRFVQRTPIHDSTACMCLSSVALMHVTMNHHACRVREDSRGERFSLPPRGEPGCQTKLRQARYRLHTKLGTRSLIETSSRCRAHPTREAGVPCPTRQCEEERLITACSCETSSVQPWHQGKAARETWLRPSIISGSKK